MAKSKNKNDITFEEAASRLEEIISKLNDQSTSLDDSLKLYGEGIELVRFCNKMLDEAELKITNLGQEGQEGKE